MHDLLMRIYIFRIRVLFWLAHICILLYILVALITNKYGIVDTYINEYVLYVIYFLLAKKIFTYFKLFLEIFTKDVNHINYADHELIGLLKHNMIRSTYGFRLWSFVLRHNNDKEIMLLCLKLDMKILVEIGNELRANPDFKNEVIEYFQSMKKDEKVLLTTLYHLDYVRDDSILRLYPYLHDIFNVKAVKLYDFFKNFDMYLELKNVNDEIRIKNNKELIYSYDKCQNWFTKEDINFGTFYEISNNRLLFICAATVYIYYGVVKHNNYLIEEFSKKDKIDGLEYKHFKSIPLKWHAEGIEPNDEVKIFYDYDNSEFKKNLDSFLENYQTNIKMKMDKLS